MQSILDAGYAETREQIPLIHVVYTDDALLMNAPEAEWFALLRGFPWERYRVYAAEYYDMTFGYCDISCVYMIIKRG